MYKVQELAEDGKLINVVYEDYENEAIDLFEEADLNAEDEVLILYTIDSKTHNEIILHREDWICK